MKNKKNFATLGNLVSGVLLLVLLVMLFLPFWNTGTEQVSIASYLGFPGDHKDLTDYLKEHVNADFSVNDVVLTPIILLVCTIAGAIFCLSNPKKGWTAVFPLICGIAGIVGYLTTPALQMGGLWIVHLIVCILMVASGVLTFIGWDRSEDEEE